MNEQPTLQSDKPRAEQVAQRAYFLWKQDGCVHGRDMDYWLRAEAELVATGNSKDLNAALAEVLVPVGREAKRPVKASSRNRTSTLRARRSAQSAAA